jgi:hypothetical protein
MARKKKRFHDDYDGHAGSDGTRRPGVPYKAGRGAPGTDAACQGEPYLALFQRVLPLGEFETLMKVYIEGVSQRQLASEERVNPGAVSRHLGALRKKAKPAALAVIATRLLEQGALDITLDPRRGRAVEDLDLWAVPDGPEVRYGHAPRLEEIHAFTAERKDILFGDGAPFLGCWAVSPGRGEWVLAVTHLYRTEDAARAAALVQRTSLVLHLLTGDLLGENRRAA